MLYTRTLSSTRAHEEYIHLHFYGQLAIYKHRDNLPFLRFLKKLDIIQNIRHFYAHK